MCLCDNVKKGYFKIAQTFVSAFELPWGEELTLQEEESIHKGRKSMVNPHKSVSKCYGKIASSSLTTA